MHFECEVTMCFRPAEISMNTCPQCGATCKPNATECPECGAAIEIVKIDEAAQQAKFAAEAQAAAKATGHRLLHPHPGHPKLLGHRSRALHA